MALDNYRDLSSNTGDVNAGFQFEFYCSNCTRKWKSPFKPYRMGQISGLFSRFMFLFPGQGARNVGRGGANFADMGSRGARDSALAEAMAHAEQLYTVCPHCAKAACADCFDTRANMCEPCVADKHHQVERAQDKQAQINADRSALACPNCRAEGNGGRFCAECGFDMASTHKSCPGCGATVGRQARFCTDCGHNF